MSWSAIWASSTRIRATKAKGLLFNFVTQHTSHTSHINEPQTAHKLPSLFVLNTALLFLEWPTSNSQM